MLPTIRLESVAALVFVFGLLAALRWWASRTGRLSASKGPLAVEQRLPLAAGHFLLVVREGNRRLLFACGPQGATLLEELPAAAPKTKAAVGSG